MMLDPSFSPPHTYLLEMRGGSCTTARPGELLASFRSNLARLGELVASSLSFLVGPGVKKCPKSDHCALLLNILHISFRKVTKPYELHVN